MRYNLYVFIVISYCLANNVFGSEEGPKNNTVFVPTTEWQVVNKGTPIPKGLHVRHNFETGITEAKLLDPQEASTTNDEIPKSLVLHPETVEEIPENKNPKFEQDDKSVKISPEELKVKLKEIKLSKTPFASKTEHANVDDKKKKFRSFKEVKKELENVGFVKTTDLELLDIFIEQFNTHKNSIISGSLSIEEVEHITDILSQLEYLVHDIDNGLEFIRSGGLVKVIYPCLNGTIEEIKLEALHVLGAAVQSNPEAKELALELEFVPSILRTLAKYGNPRLMDRGIYALGSLMRHYPAAQKVFLSHGGMEIFSQVLTDGSMSTQKRVMNLINDLIVERQDLDKIDDSQSRNSKTEEYADVKLGEKIVEHKFCTQLGKLLVKITENEIKTEFIEANYDLLEAIYECTLTASSICKSEFQQNKNQILSTLDGISIFYNNSVPELYRDENDLLLNLLTLVKKIQEIVFEKLHDEL